MGGEPYYYFVPYENDYNSALQKLREREFKAGRYFPATFSVGFLPGVDTVSPGAKHDTINDAIEDAAEEGTKSILDLHKVSEEEGFCIARILSPDETQKYFGTDKPEHEQVVNCMELFESVERGCGVCVPVFRDGEPVELFFMGYSFD